jgi:hypothetical protein
MTIEFKKFDDAMRKILSVSNDELKRRESEWKKRKSAKKQPKSKA